ncbi:MAG: GNAT family N-acetyltransferase [Subdoligranulum sp.]|nr:GNAT family N-acetyltransferase [Subdoligranulum sp.]
MTGTDDLTIQKLRTHAVREVYREYLRKDFPPDERRPLWHIMSLRRRRQYLCYGAFCAGRLVGYAFFVLPAPEGKHCCLFDYFAVLPELRGRGIGSGFLTQLKEKMRHMELVLTEVEDPNRERNPAKRSVMERRLSFYFANGLRDTGVRVETFGVPYRILAVPLSSKKPAVTQEEARSAYAALYRVLTTKGMFRRHIRFV